MAFAVGQRVGDYDLIDILDSAKTGVTYKVRNVLAQRFEMLKLLPKTLQEDRERVDRFLREIKVHARLTHPNIVTFYNATQVEGQLVMTTELVEGMTLAQKLDSGPLPSSEAVRLVDQVLAALIHAHGQNVVHREITPSNLMITADGTVKLSGFGLAKALTDPQLTQVGTMMGALEYMSPEQVKGVGTLDARTDIYSLGAVLYQLATGKLPFQSKSQFDILMAHINQTPTFPSEVNPAVPKELDAIILKALAKDPAQRYQSAKEFRAALASLGMPASNAAEPRAAHAAAPAAVAEKPRALPAMTGSGEPASVMALSPKTWRTPELVAAGVFMFIIVAVAAFTLLSITKF